MDDWIDLWAEDSVHIYPYNSELVSERIEGKKAIFEWWKGIPDAFDSMDFPIHELWVDQESRTAIARIECHNVMRGGKRYDNLYIMVFKFDNQGKIKEYLEYFNPITVGVTYGWLKVEKIEQ